MSDIVVLPFVVDSEKFPDSSGIIHFLIIKVCFFFNNKNPAKRFD
jgi:hypothetical protein